MKTLQNLNKNSSIITYFQPTNFNHTHQIKHTFFTFPKKVQIEVASSGWRRDQTQTLHGKQGHAVELHWAAVHSAVSLYDEEKMLFVSTVLYSPFHSLEALWWRKLVHTLLFFTIPRSVLWSTTSHSVASNRKQWTCLAKFHPPSLPIAPKWSRALSSSHCAPLCEVWKPSDHSSYDCSVLALKAG